MTASNAIRVAFRNPLVIVGLVFFAAILLEAVRQDSQPPPMIQFAFQDFDSDWQELGECLDSSADLCDCRSKARAVIMSGDRLLNTIQEEDFSFPKSQVTEMMDLARRTARPC